MTSVTELVNRIKKLQSDIDIVVTKGIDLSSVDEDKAVYEFDQRKRSYYLTSIVSGMEAVKGAKNSLMRLAEEDTSNESPVAAILELADNSNTSDMGVLRENVEKMLEAAKNLKIPQHSFSIPKGVPADIRPDMVADLEEIQKCYDNGCYRSAVVLCGRCLEMALHRKYFEATGNDILEKSPGIGLGNLIGKLAEKNVKLDPGLTQQIHLINQVRVFSVHKKQEAFYPSREQSQAIILYTLDVLNKMFK